MNLLKEFIITFNFNTDVSLELIFIEEIYNIKMMCIIIGQFMKYIEQYFLESKKMRLLNIISNFFAIKIKPKIISTAFIMA